MDIKIGKYRHYKGKEYQLIGIGRHSDTFEKYAVYQGLYNSDEFGPNPIWVRPVKVFMEKVLVGDQEVDRFTYLGE